MKGNFKKPNSIEHQAKRKAQKEYQDYQKEQRNRTSAIYTMVVVGVLIFVVLFAIAQSI